MLGFLETRLDDVADRDQSEQLAAPHHRQVAEATAGHDFHDIVDRLVGVAGHDVAGHHLPGLQLQRLGTMAGQGTNEISFGDDAGDPAVTIQHQHRSDATDTQLLGHLGHRCLGAHREDTSALLGENVGDEHGSSSFW